MKRMRKRHGRSYLLQCRVPGKTPWEIEERLSTKAEAERAKRDLEKREPVNDDGEPLEYRVFED